MTENEIRDALRGVIDPELGVNIVDLGLVYGVGIDGSRVRVDMTMTTPACPLGDYLRDLVEAGIKQRIAGVERVDVDLVWDPPWNPDMMSDAARRRLEGGE